MNHGMQTMLTIELQNMNDEFLGVWVAESIFVINRNAKLRYQNKI